MKMRFISISSNGEFSNSALVCGLAMMLGKLVRGAHAQAACLGGHLPVNYRGHKCACGNVGCAEAEASGWALPRIVRETPGFDKSSLAGVERIDFQALFAAARN